MMRTAFRHVVTYTEAYRDYPHDLCDQHAADDAAELRREAGLGPLGAVSRGKHRGACCICEYSAPRAD